MSDVFKNWRPSPKVSDAVVRDCDLATCSLDRDCHDYYGGHLVAESMDPRVRTLVAAGPEMLEALRSEEYAQLLANHPESQPQAQVARVRADDLRRAALAKAGAR